MKKEWMKTKSATHQVTAQMPVSSEWTRDTERFLHFHVFQGSVSTMAGQGTVCRNLWRILKVTEQHKTYRAGYFWTSFSHVSILHSLSCGSQFFGQRVLVMLFPWWSKLSNSVHVNRSQILEAAPAFFHFFLGSQALCIYSPPSRSFLHVPVPVIGVVSVTVPVCSTLIGWWWIYLWDSKTWNGYISFPWTFCVHLPVFHNPEKMLRACSDAVVSSVCVCGNTIEQ